MTQPKKAGEMDYEIGSTNVYADLERPNAEALLIKAGLVRRIDALLEERGLSQTKASALLGIPQPKLSSMLRGQFRGFSERKLMDCLTKLGQDVQITVSHAAKANMQGEISLRFA